MSEASKTTEQRIFDRLDEIGRGIDREVLRFLELATMLPIDQQEAAARKCGTVQYGNEQHYLIQSLERASRVHYTIISSLNTAINACEKKVERERSRAAKMMNTIKRLRKGA